MSVGLSADPVPVPREADGRLVSEYLTGQDEAFAILYRRYYPRIVGWVTARTGDRALGEDVAQDALMAAARYLGTFNIDRPFWPWLRRIASHALSQRLADMGRETPLNEVTDTAAPDSDDLLEQLSCRGRIRSALAAIPSRQRAALWLRYAEELSSDEAAGVFGISPNAFDQLIWRARKTFRQELDRLAAAGFGAMAAPFALVARMFRGARQAKATAASAGSSTLGPLAALPAISLTIVGAVGAPLVALGDAGHGAAGTGAARVTTAAATAHHAGAGHAARGQMRLSRSSSTPALTHSAKPSAPEPSGTALSERRGPATAETWVSKTPTGKGRAEHHRVAVDTPVGTVYLEGETANAAPVICRVATCE